SLDGSGQATLSAGALSLGSHSITAVYSGDSNFKTSTSSALTQTVNQATTTTRVSSSVNPSTYGQSVTFTAAVTGTGATGTVTFLAAPPPAGSGPVGSGPATLSAGVLSLGSHSITAIY